MVKRNEMFAVEIIILKQRLLAICKRIVPCSHL